MITSIEQARRVQKKYACRKTGLAPAVRRYINRAFPEVQGQFVVKGPHWADFMEELGLVVS